jgi:hypothetical protein
VSNAGIDVVRNRIKGFAQKKVTLPQGRHKLVILDEADRSAFFISFFPVFLFKALNTMLPQKV